MNPYTPPLSQPKPPLAPPPETSRDPSGSMRLFTVSGIRVFVHWSWALIALWQINRGKAAYYEVPWAVAEYLSLFGIVLLHEFGHAFATRQTGGRADTILLWPFGGIAFVQAPPRPGAHLWGLAAGPLVNVVLFPVFYFLNFGVGPGLQNPDAAQFLWSLFWINTMLLVFNMLPIYPLDGGQILRTLLWFKFGPLNSLQAAAITGLVLGGALALAIVAAALMLDIRTPWWTLLIIGLIVMQCWRALQQVLEIKRSGLADRH